MKFTTVSSPVKNYDTYKNTLSQNSTTFENTSIKTEYVNDELKYYDTTEQLISEYDNILFSRYKMRILSKCEIKVYAPEKMMIYNYRPERVSMDEYGTPDLWYLIMYMNDCENIDDFKDFTYLKIPNLNDVLEILQNQEFVDERAVSQII